MMKYTHLNIFNYYNYIFLIVPFKIYIFHVYVLSAALRYTFGEVVQGDVRINAALEASGRRETLPFYDVNATLVRRSSGRP